LTGEDAAYEESSREINTPPPVHLLPKAGEQVHAFANREAENSHSNSLQIKEKPAEAVKEGRERERERARERGENRNRWRDTGNLHVQSLKTGAIHSQAFSPSSHLNDDHYRQNSLKEKKGSMPPDWIDFLPLSWEREMKMNLGPSSH